MFTGLIETVGRVVSVKSGRDFARFEIEAPDIIDDVKIGDSIAVNGLCLTAVELNGDCFQADVMAESLRRSSLGRLKAGSRVNLERALAANGRLGGHIVSGHIDGTGEILGLAKEGIATVVTIGADRELIYYIVEKGSIAIDGISLTVKSVGESSFTVGIIPHTSGETTLTEKAPGDIVNLETDVIGKYTEHFLKNKKPEKSEEITLEFLAENGF
ncbi:MAG: riboflavin synthase [Clostridiales bacterium]|nr:riboflavin synthase [Clostridiales bacterium]